MTSDNVELDDDEMGSEEMDVEAVEEPVQLSALPSEEPESTLEGDTATIATFASSGATIILPKQRSRHPRLLFAAFMLVLASVSGFMVGVDFIEGDEGLYTDRGFIYSQTFTAPERSAILTGKLTLGDNGEPAVNYTVRVNVEYTADNGLIVASYIWNETNSDGEFRLEDLNPGVARMTIMNNSNTSEGVTHRILLTPPALFEPKGFTYLDITYPTQAEFDEQREATSNISSWLDYSEEQRENGTELYDSTAAAMYDMAGTFFSGLSIITVVMAITGVIRNSPALVRLGAVTGFFCMGHWYVACCFGLVAGLMTIGVKGGDI